MSNHKSNTKPVTIWSRPILDPYSEQDRNLTQIRKQASENTTKTQDSNEKLYNVKHKEATKYKIGDYVVIRNIDVTPGVNKKLLPKFKGPYEIKNVLDHDRYVVSDTDGFQLTQKPFTTIIGPDQMKLWNHE